MPSLTGDFINADVNKVTKISIRQSIVNNILNSFTDGIPMETKELTNDLPSHKFRPGSQDHTQRQRKWAFSLSPGDRLHLNATVTAFDPSGRINQGDGDTPERNMLPTPFFQRVVPRSLATTRGTNNLTSSIGEEVNHYFTMFFSDLFDAMSLESQGLSDYTFNEHESYPPFLSDLHEQEVLDLIHAFKFLNELSTHKFV